MTSLLFPVVLFAQSGYLDLNLENNLRFEKQKYSDSNFHSNIKPFLLASNGSEDSLKRMIDIKTAKNSINILLNNNLWIKQGQGFSVYVNPVLHFSPRFNISTNEILEDFRAGLSIGGNIGKSFSYKLNGIYGTASYTDYICQKADTSGSLPEIGPFLTRHANRYNYTDITSYISFTPFKSLNLSAGIGKNFWGEGYRSLFLSEIAPEYPFFKASIDVWKFKYIWLIGYLKNFETTTAKIEPKLLFSHYLSWNATRWLNFNFFESIISNPVDSTGVAYFNFNYLNPVIFFRPVEFAGGSADNALLGFGFKVKIYKKYQVYSQMVIDEFIWSELKSGSGWWGNKFGIQAGIKIFDLFRIKSMFLLTELNVVRPYTYSYSNSILNYGSYYQPLAHPSGGNFKEWVILSHYHKKRLSVQIKGIFCKAGMDSDSISYGQDIHKSYISRVSDYDNKLLQGYKSNYSHFELKISWLINPSMNHTVFIALSHEKYKYPATDAGVTYISSGLKCNIWNTAEDYLQ